MTILLHNLGPSFFLAICALLLSLHETAAWAEAALDHVFDAVALEVVLVADVGELEGLQDPMGADAGAEVEGQTLGRLG